MGQNGDVWPIEDGTDIGAEHRHALSIFNADIGDCGTAIALHHDAILVVKGRDADTPACF